jgi:hypothetical protein
MIHRKVVRDAATGLIKALMELSDGSAQLIQHRGSSWASATFTGMRHIMELMFEGNEAIGKGDHIAEIIAEHEFMIAGHIVADIAIAEMFRRQEGDPVLTMKIEALTVEDS